VVNDPTPFSLRDGALFWLGECRYRMNDWTGAAAAYSQVLREHPQSTFRDRAAYGLGWAHIKDNNPKSAVESFALVSKKDPKLWIDARLKMGFLMVRYGFDPTATQAVYEEILAQPGLTGPQQFEAHLQVGIGRFNASLFAEALTHFEKALPLAPPDKRAVVQFYIGESLFRSRRYADAEVALARVAEASPTPDLADKALYSLAWCKIKG
jgi:TolA-binding protein